MLLQKLIDEYGVNNCLVLIGSTNVYNERTPYTFEDRSEMVKSAFPEIKVLPFPDEGSDDVWLDNLNELEKEIGQKFVFYGGSKKDLEILGKRFETHILIDRFTEGRGINATEIREKLRSEGKLPSSSLGKS